MEGARQALAQLGRQGYQPKNWRATLQGPQAAETFKLEASGGARADLPPAVVRSGHNGALHGVGGRAFLWLRRYVLGTVSSTVSLSVIFSVVLSLSCSCGILHRRHFTFESDPGQVHILVHFGWYCFNESWWACVLLHTTRRGAGNVLIILHLRVVFRLRSREHEVHILVHFRW